MADTRTRYTLRLKMSSHYRDMIRASLFLISVTVPISKLTMFAIGHGQSYENPPFEDISLAFCHTVSLRTRAPKRPYTVLHGKWHAPEQYAHQNA